MVVFVVGKIGRDVHDVEFRYSYQCVCCEYNLLNVKEQSKYDNGGKTIKV